MTGTITKYRYRKRKKDGSTVSWGYYFKAEGKQFTKSGYPSKEDAEKALKSAIAAQTGAPQAQPAETPPPQQLAPPNVVNPSPLCQPTNRWNWRRDRGTFLHRRYADARGVLGLLA